jgi:hypothetical protein
MEAKDLEGVARGVHAKGKPIELYIAAYCMLARPGDLCVSTSFIDDEGVDLVFNRWGRTATLAVRVESRFADSAQVKRGDFIADVKRSTFQGRKSFYVLFAVADPDLVELDPLWLVPSEELDKKHPDKESIRFEADIKTATQGTGQWDPYALHIADLPQRLRSILDELDTEASGEPLGKPSAKEDSGETRYWMAVSGTLGDPLPDEWRIRVAESQKAHGPVHMFVARPNVRAGDRLVMYASGTPTRLGAGRIFAVREVVTDPETSADSRWPWQVEYREIVGGPDLPHCPTIDEIHVSPTSLRRKTHIKLDAHAGVLAERLLERALEAHGGDGEGQTA